MANDRRDRFQGYFCPACDEVARRFMTDAVEKVVEIIGES